MLVSKMCDEPIYLVTLLVIGSVGVVTGFLFCYMFFVRGVE